MAFLLVIIKSKDNNKMLAQVLSSSICQIIKHLIFQLKNFEVYLYIGLTVISDHQPKIHNLIIKSNN